MCVPIEQRANGPRRPRSALLLGSASLSAAALVAALGGGIFWATAARLADQRVTGQAAAIANALTLITLLAGLSFLPVVTRFGADTGPVARSVFNRAAVSASISACAMSVALIAVVVVMHVDQLAMLQHAWGMIVFVIAAVSGAITVLVDVRLVRAHRYRWIVIRSAVVSIVGVALVAMRAGHATPTAMVFVGFSLAALGGPVIWVLTSWHDSDRFAWSAHGMITGEVARYRRTSFSGAVIARLGVNCLPLAVALRVTSEQNAQFFIAWNIAVVLLMVVQNVDKMLLIQGNADATRPLPVRQSTMYGTSLAVAGVVAAVIASPLLRLVYGDKYSSAAPLLRILSLSLVPAVFYGIGYSIACVRHWSRLMVAMPVLLTTSVLGPLGILWPHLSGTKAAVVWVVAMTVAGSAGIVVILARRWEPTEAGL